MPVFDRKPLLFSARGAHAVVGYEQDVVVLNRQCAVPPANHRNANVVAAACSLVAAALRPQHRHRDPFRILDEHVERVGDFALGITVNAARCHDLRRMSNPKDVNHLREDVGIQVGDRTARIVLVHAPAEIAAHIKGPLRCIAEEFVPQQVGAGLGVRVVNGHAALAEVARSEDAALGVDRLADDAVLDQLLHLAVCRIRHALRAQLERAADFAATS